eukprot:TRINITY_DN4201_c0_g1_i1.p1 TRINITY_DN4201_c0_g1~~TRINITY_DN4201_c0_g1_i1.p1  ORF type:complete len:160 (+),score=27.18 TRINITY_DN4201_c0_g1_i1:139-618(+)
MLSPILILSLLFASVLSKDLRQHISKEPLIGYIPVAQSDFKFEYKVCDSGSDDIVINSLEIDFSDYVLSVSYDVIVKKQVTGGTLYVSATLSKYQITQNYTKDLCDLAKIADTECLIEADNYKGTVSHSLYQVMDVEGSVKASDQNGDPLLCLYYTVTV